MDETYLAQMKGGRISENYLFTLCAFLFVTTETHHSSFSRVKYNIILTSFSLKLFQITAPVQLDKNILAVLVALIFI